MSAAAPRGTPLQALLDALPETGCRSCAELADLTGTPAKKVASRCAMLRLHGLIATPQTGCYQLTEAGRIARDAGTASRSGPKGPLTGRRVPSNGLTRLIWSALRRYQKATLPELLQLTGAAKRYRDPEPAARRYLRVLCAAGYVAVMRRREPGTAPTSPGYLRYLLVRDTGPQAPVYSPKHRDLTDPNTGERIVLPARGAAS